MKHVLLAVGVLTILGGCQKGVSPTSSALTGQPSPFENFVITVWGKTYYVDGKTPDMHVEFFRVTNRSFYLIATSPELHVRLDFIAKKDLVPNSTAKIIMDDSKNDTLYLTNPAKKYVIDIDNTFVLGDLIYHSQGGNEYMQFDGKISTNDVDDGIPFGASGQLYFWCSAPH